MRVNNACTFARFVPSIHPMKWSYIWMVCLGLSLAASYAARAEPYIMLEVNGEGIKASDVDAHWQRLFPGSKAPALETMPGGIRHNILRAIASERLLLRAAEDADIHKSTSFQQRLQHNRNQLLISEFLAARSADATSERALSRAYLRYVQERKEQTEYRVSHILLESKEEADAIHNRLQQGESFIPLAREYSRDPGSAAQGGDLGYVTPEQLVAPFATAMQALEPGAISAPFETPFGWHIMRLAETRDAAIEPLNAVRDELKNALERKANEAYINQLMRDAKIVLYDGKGNVLPFDKSPKEMFE
jgi:peptidyl-prolyl cis-trans isomerase C